MKRIIFCDFDGTISTEDTFVSILRQIVPEACDRIMPQIFAKQITLRQGVRDLVESIRSSDYEKIIELSKPCPMRRGFVELLDFLDAHQIPLVIVSGGLRCMVETVIGDLRDRVLDIHACDLDRSDEFVKLRSPCEYGSEIVAKAKIVASYECDQAIAIGDSITDVQMALHVPIVFARDRLAEYLDQEYHKPYFAWQDFFDVRDRLAQYLDIDLDTEMKVQKDQILLNLSSG